MIPETAKIRLANAAMRAANQHRLELEHIKAGAAKFDQPDWIWEALLLSFGTMGNSRGAVLVHNPQIHATVRFDALRELSRDARRDAIETALRAAKVRMPSVKTRWLVENFDRIVADGGLQAVKDRLSECRGIAAKLRFLRTFKGIGQKYARNLMMDVYHPDFRDSIAVDVRIKSVSARLGLAFTRYADEEKFYLCVARRAGLSGWELDRLLYNFTADVVSGLPPSES